MSFSPLALRAMKAGRRGASVWKVRDMDFGDVLQGVLGGSLSRTETL